MSPSESDLRAALRDGEGEDGPDVDGLLAHVRGRRAQRRTRVLSTAAAVVVVAAAAVGGAALWGGSDDHPSAGSRATFHTGPLPAPSGTPTDVVVACPADAPRATDPPGRTPTTAPERRMFAAPVATVTVCSYTEAGSVGGRPTDMTFSGSDATALATSIETASPVKLKIMCPDIATADKTELAIIGVTAGGTQLPVVTTDVSIPNCNQPITNGTAVRYAWKPPAALAARINALGIRTGSSLPTPGGTKNGTPVR